MTRATVRHTPAPASATARSRACRALLARKAQVGPEPQTIAPSAPNSTPAASVRRSSGRSEIAAGSRSLASSGPSPAASPDRSAVISAVSSAGRCPPSGPAAQIRSCAAYTSAVDSPPCANASTQ